MKYNYFIGFLLFCIVCITLILLIASCQHNRDNLATYDSTSADVTESYCNPETEISVSESNFPSCSLTTKRKTEPTTVATEEVLIEKMFTGYWKTNAYFNSGVRVFAFKRDGSYIDGTTSHNVTYDGTYKLIGNRLYIYNYRGKLDDTLMYNAASGKFVSECASEMLIQGGSTINGVYYKEPVCTPRTLTHLDKAPIGYSVNPYTNYTTSALSASSTLNNDNAFRLLSDTLACYARCNFNQNFNIYYDESVKTVRPGSQNYDFTDDAYLVTNYKTKDDIVRYIDENLCGEAGERALCFLDDDFSSDRIFTSNGDLYFCSCVMKGSVGYDLSTINVTEQISDYEYLVEVDTFNDTYCGTDVLSIKYLNGKYKVDTVLEDQCYNKPLPAETFPNDSFLVG